jgi:hypothetical protein
MGGARTRLARQAPQHAAASGHADVRVTRRRCLQDLVLGNAVVPLSRLRQGLCKIPLMSERGEPLGGGEHLIAHLSLHRGAYIYTCSLPVNTTHASTEPHPWQLYLRTTLDVKCPRCGTMCPAGYA